MIPAILVCTLNCVSKNARENCVRKREEVFVPVLFRITHCTKCSTDFHAACMFRARRFLMRVRPFQRTEEGPMREPSVSFSSCHASNKFSFPFTHPSAS